VERVDPGGEGRLQGGGGVLQIGRGLSQRDHALQGHQVLDGGLARETERVLQLAERLRVGGGERQVRSGQRTPRLARLPPHERLDHAPAHAALDGLDQLGFERGQLARQPRLHLAELAVDGTQLDEDRLSAGLAASRAEAGHRADQAVSSRVRAGGAGPGALSRGRTAAASSGCSSVGATTAANRGPGCAQRSPKGSRNTAATGAPQATARCIGPVSLVTTRLAARNAAASCSRFVGGAGSAAPPEAADTSRASAPSPGPPNTTAPNPRSSRRRRANAANRAAGQRWSCLRAPGFNAAKAPRTGEGPWPSEVSRGGGGRSRPSGCARRIFAITSGVPGAGRAAMPPYATW